MNDLRILLDESVPLPKRPGSMWDMDMQSDRCKRCGKGYNSHGAPSDVATAFSIPENRRHLICPASDELWAAYHREIGARNTESYLQMVKTELQKFTPAQQHEIVVELSRFVSQQFCGICAAGIPLGYQVCPACGRK